MSGVGGSSGPQTRSSGLFGVVSETVGYTLSNAFTSAVICELSIRIPISTVQNVQKQQRSVYKKFCIVSSLCKYSKECLLLCQSPQHVRTLPDCDFK